MPRNVTVRFTGDDSDLVRATDHASRAVHSGADDIDKSGRKIGDSVGSGLGKIGENADAAGLAMMGMSSIMSGLDSGNILDIVTGVGDLARGAFEAGRNFVELGKKAFEGGKKLVESYGAAAAAKAKDIAAAVAHRAATIASTIATQAQAAAQWLLNAAMDANPVVLIVIAIAALVAALVLAYQHSDRFRAIVDAVAGALRDGFLAVVEAVGVAVSFVADRISDAVGFFADLPGRVLTAVGDLARTLWNAIAAGFDWIISTAIPGVLTLWVDLYIKLPLRVLEAVGDLGAKLWGAITAGMSWLLGKIGEFILAFVQFFIDLPGKLAGVVADVGSKIVTGLWDALVATWDEVWDLAGKLISFFAGLAGSVFLAVVGAAAAIAHALWDGIKATLEAVWDLGGWIMHALAVAIDFVVDGAFGLGKRLVEAIVDGIKSLPGLVTGAINGLIPSGIHIPGTSIDIGIPGIPGFASGGFASGWTVVGEKGPELANFGSGGAQIYSNADSQRMLGGGSTMVFYITAPDRATGDYAAQSVAATVRRTLAVSLRGAVA